MKNHTFDDLRLKVALPTDWQSKNVEIISQNKTVEIGAGKNVTLHFFVKFPKEVTGSEGARNITVDFINQKDNEVLIEEDVKLVGPKSI